MAIPGDNYAIPVAYAIGSILVVLMFCLVCHRRLRRQSRGVPIDDLPPQCVIDDHHCYHHHDLLHTDHTLTRFNQYQLEEPSPLNESDEMEEPEQDFHQETSSPDSV
ncbi:unnamed protein product [Lasius platythorax]|uniref:Cubilin-like isoform x8 protein n=2 Tax=Lasius TaxID=488720 RepID=A0A0J7K1F5_LASNI|nr:cubilin-like isoform x8 protein [Lasius niger]